MNEIKVRTEDDFTIIEIIGELSNGNNIDDLKNEIQSQVLTEQTKQKLKIIIDLEQTSKIDSMGLAAILDCDKKINQHKGELKLSGGNEKIINLFEITKLDRILSWYDAIETAKEYF